MITPTLETRRPSLVHQRRLPGGDLRQEPRPVARIPLHDLANRSGHLHRDQAAGTVLEHMERPGAEDSPLVHISDDHRLPGTIAQLERSPREGTAGRLISRSTAPITPSPYFGLDARRDCGRECWDEGGLVPPYPGRRKEPCGDLAKRRVQAAAPGRWLSVSRPQVPPRHHAAVGGPGQLGETAAGEHLLGAEEPLGPSLRSGRQWGSPRPPLAPCSPASSTAAVNNARVMPARRAPTRTKKHGPARRPRPPQSRGPSRSWTRERSPSRSGSGALLPPNPPAPRGRRRARAGPRPGT